jgi:hypothetical protein
MDRTSAHVVRGVAYGTTGAYELFFSSSRLGQSTVSLTRKARKCCGREKAYTTFFYIHWRESFSLVGGSFLSVSSSESTFLQNCHNGRGEQPSSGASCSGPHSGCSQQHASPLSLGIALRHAPFEYRLRFYPCIVPCGAEGIRGSGQSAFSTPLMVAPSIVRCDPAITGDKSRYHSRC